MKSRMSIMRMGKLTEFVFYSKLMIRMGNTGTCASLREVRADNANSTTLRVSPFSSCKLRA